jgi:hypothetical protein
LEVEPVDNVRQTKTLIGQGRFREACSLCLEVIEVQRESSLAIEAIASAYLGGDESQLGRALRSVVALPKSTLVVDQRVVDLLGHLSTEDLDLPMRRARALRVAAICIASFDETRSYARNAFEKALFYERNAETYCDMASWLDAAPHTKEQWLREAVQLEPENCYARFLIAEICHSDGRIEEANAIIRLPDGTARRDTVIWGEFALIKAELGEKDEARRAIDHILATDRSYLLRDPDPRLHGLLREFCIARPGQ